MMCFGRYDALGLLVVAFGLLLCMVGHSFAATQGSAGNISSGSISLTVTKSSEAEISGLNDMVVTWEPTGNDLVWTDDICVYSSRSSGKYTITATGSSKSAGAFILNNGNKALPYAVVWNDGGVGNLSNQGAALQPGVPLVTQTKAATDSTSCHGAGGGATARLIITIPQTALAAADEGSYTESLTLLVAPD